MNKDAVEFRVTRVEVIDHTSTGEGRAFVKWEKFDIDVGFSQQDDGRTLKIFLEDTQPLKEKE